MTAVTPIPPSASGVDFSWLSYDCNFHGYITCSGCGPDTPHYANDIQTPCNTPITALFDGTVVNSQCTNWGYQLFIQMDNGQQYYYYHLKTLNVTSGQYVRAGQFIGFSGGDPTDVNQSCRPSSTWTNGCHTHVGFFNGYKNGIPYGPDITPYISEIRQGIGLPACNQSSNQTPLFSFTNLTSNVPTAVKNAYATVTDTSPITELFILFDDLCQAINPFDVQEQYALGGIGGIGDPVNWLIQVSLNIVGDTIAFVLRTTMFLVGMYILFKVINALVNVTGKLQFGARLVGSAASVGLI